MKAKELVAKIAKSEEYSILAKLVGKITDHPEKITSEIADELFLFFNKILNEVAEKKTGLLNK